MDEKLTQLRAAFAQLAARENDNRTKCRLSELEELPFTWDELQTRFREGKMEIREMSIYPGDFGLFASKGQQVIFGLFRLISLTLPIVGISLAMIDTWWWILLLLLALPLLQIAKKVYRRAIAATACAAEDVFCLLFSRNLIFLFRKDGPPIYRRHPAEEQKT